MKFEFPKIIHDEPELPTKKNKFHINRYKAMYRAYLRTRCAEAQNWRCCYCTRVMTVEEKISRLSVTLEHLIPVSKGGQDIWENCVAACARCNERRSVHDLGEEYELPEFLTKTNCNGHYSVSGRLVMHSPKNGGDIGYEKALRRIKEKKIKNKEELYSWMKTKGWSDHFKEIVHDRVKTNFL